MKTKMPATRLRPPKADCGGQAKAERDYVYSLRS